MARNQDAAAEERRLVAEERRVAAEERKVALEERKVGMEERAKLLEWEKHLFFLDTSLFNDAQKEYVNLAREEVLIQKRAMIRTMGGGGLGGMGGGGLGAMGGMGLGAMGGMGGGGFGAMGGFGAPSNAMGGMDGMSFASLMGGMGAPPAMGGMSFDVPHTHTHENAVEDLAKTVGATRDAVRDEPYRLPTQKSRSKPPRNVALASAISATSGSTGLPHPGSGGAEDGGHGFGGFLSWLFNAGAAHAAEEKPLSRDWDAHEFGARTTVPFARLQGAKKYKVSDVRFLDRRALGGGGARVTGPEDPLFEGAALRPGEVYTRSQLLRELEALSSCGMFDGVKVEAVRPQPDGTLGLTVSYAETLCPPAKRFSCVNVGGLLPAQADEVDDDDMTEREKIALDPAEA
ncbi:Protein TOC75, chloroplastic [Hordeum vulgare]|nr:Protein TOC75, chloroplastic [Hordeum vulgare]